MEKVQKYLSELKLGEKTVFNNLTMFAVGAATEGCLEYLTLADAIRADVARVSEISDGGSVPELRFTNSADLPVLILDGEELVGAKQNRTVNLTILAPAGKTISIPVSCVESGRWRRESFHFETSDRHHYARGRAVRTASVSCAMQQDGSRRSDQGRVWADISAKAARMEAPSATQAMAAIFERHRGSLESYVEAFRVGERQTGAIFAIGTEIVGVDLFDRSATLGRVLPKLIRSYAIDAVESNTPCGRGVGRKRASEWLRFIAEAGFEAYPAVGLGTDLRLSASGLVGGGLAMDGELVHLAAFTCDSDSGDSGGDSGGMVRMSARRRSYRHR